MGISDEYKKMVLSLPDEFFEGWEWSTGDKAVNVLNNRRIVVLWVTNPDKWKTERYAAYYNYHPSFSKEVFTKIKLCDIRPIPSQEQLQKMVISSLNYYSNDFLISKLFISSVIEGDLVENIENKTLDEMWLEFVMFMVYEKRWDGEKWI